MDQDQDVPDGAMRIKQLRDAGYPEDKVQAWISKTADSMKAANYPAEKIRSYFGFKEPDMGPAKAVVKDNLANQKNEDGTSSLPSLTDKRTVDVGDVSGAMAAGWQNSVTGLFTHGKPDVEMPQNASVLQTLAANAAQLAGDFPAMLMGGGIMSETGPVGAAAGAWAAPAAMRKVLMDHYEKGDIVDAADFAQRAVGMTWEAAKGAITGAATAAVGGNIAAVNAMATESRPFLQAISGTAGRLSGELVAMTTVSKALEGQLPDRNDFINGAVAIAGLHGVGFGVTKLGEAAPQVDYVAKKLMNIYRNTGANPGEVIEAATKDPTLKGELLSDDDKLPKEASVPKEDQPVTNPPATAEDNKPPEQFDTDKEKDLDEQLSIIGKAKEPEGKSVGDKVDSAIDEAIANGVDSTNAVKIAVNEMDPNAKGEKNAHILQRLFAAVNNKVWQFLDVGTRDFNTGKINGESLSDILNDVKDMGRRALDRFKAYGLAARTLELGYRGLERPGTENLSDAQSLQRRVLAANSDMKPLFDRFVQFGNRVLDYVVASGRYSKESGEAMKDMNQRHINMQALLEPDENGDLPRGTKGIKRIGDVDNDHKIQDPLKSRVETMRGLIKLAEETKVHNTFLENVFKDDLEKHIGAEPALETDQEKLTGQDQLRLTGETPDIDITPGQDDNKPEPLATRSKDQEGPLKDNEIAYWRDGERTKFTVPMGVKESLNSMHGNDVALGAWMSLLKPFAFALRLGTVNNPLFALRHAWRQNLTAPTLSQTGLKLFQAFSYLPEFLSGKSDRIKDFYFDGGAVTRLQPLTEGWLDGKIYELNNKAPIFQKGWNVMKTAFDFAHLMIVNHDNLIRFAEYSRALDQGQSRTEAAFAGREVLPDPQKSGLKTSALMQMTAFANIHIQGQARMFQAVGKDYGVLTGALRGEVDPLDAVKKLGTGYIAKNLAYITVPSVLLMAAQHDDDAINDLPDWQKFNYWNIHMDNWRPANSLAEAMSVKSAYPSNYKLGEDGVTHLVNDGTIYRIQKPFTNGIMFGSGIEAALEALKKGDPKSFKDFVKTVGGSVVPEGIPNAIQPIMEQAYNKNSYTGQPLVRQSMEGKLPETQYDRYTSETAKILGKALSYVPLIKDIGPNDAKLSSPKVIDNYIHSWTGTLGYYAVDAADKGLVAAGVAPKTVKPVDTLADIPFVKEFVDRFPSAHPQSVSDFEDRYNQANRVFNSIRQLQKQGDYNGAADLQRRYESNMMRLTGVSKAIQNLNSVIQKVYQNPDIDPVQKRQLIDSAMYQMTTMAKHGNDVMDKFDSRAANTGS